MQNNQPDLVPEIIQFVYQGLTSNVEYKNQLYYIARIIIEDGVPDKMVSWEWQEIRLWKEEIEKLYNQVLPIGGSAKKVRELSDFFTEQEYIYSEDDDLSSEDRSPMNSRGAFGWNDDIP